MDVDGRRIAIPVSTEIKARFDEQFWREKLSDQQSKRLATLLNIARAAYKKGLLDGKSE